MSIPFRKWVGMEEQGEVHLHVAQKGGMAGMESNEISSSVTVVQAVVTLMECQRNHQPPAQYQVAVGNNK